MDDPYAVLGLNKHRSTRADIKRRYKELVLMYHPDKNPPEKKEEMEQKFRTIQEAYEALRGKKDRPQKTYTDEWDEMTDMLKDLLSQHAKGKFPSYQPWRNCKTKQPSPSPSWSSSSESESELDSDDESVESSSSSSTSYSMWSDDEE
eukprot:jgi/Botrbrau1/19260/Bobra.0073s0010.1